MTWDELRSFAMGELGWTLKRWRDSTFTEFNYASSGYWRHWERFVGIPTRELCYTTICMTPGATNKPSSAQDMWPLSIDKEKKDPVRPTAEDIRKAKEGAKDLLNGKRKINS